ncbi:unnamed protein product [Bursaphelenchus okinawaensis]|uniref:Uncharacterized protein n=1 Tax=Bursaphelenchus okinawaensis TaxID=465554 RepID=A0A811JVS7_9BILA|nr:unnamed protein product [Bursaphelenchus okinawaensis]CAG9085485.1 unnamed protein product [Bursaphelenchus okinawaensis]
MSLAYERIEAFLIVITSEKCIDVDQKDNFMFHFTINFGGSRNNYIVIEYYPPHRIFGLRLSDKAQCFTINTLNLKVQENGLVFVLPNIRCKENRNIDVPYRKIGDNRFKLDIRLDFSGYPTHYKDCLELNFPNSLLLTRSDTASYLPSLFLLTIVVLTVI